MKKVRTESFRDFIRELKETGAVIRWAFKMADSPETRPWAYKRYGFMIALVVVGLVQSAVISYVFKGAIEKNYELVVLSISGIAALYLFQRLFVHLTWGAHEHMFGAVLHNIHRRITEQFFEKSLYQHRELKGLNHESIAKGKNRLFDLYMDDVPEAVEVVSLIVISYLFIWFLLPEAGLIMTAFVLLYLGWTVYLNYRVSVECPPIEEEFTAFERYMASRWKFAERVIVSAKETDELEELESRWNNVIAKDKKFWLWHLRQSSVRDLLSAFIIVGVFALGAKMVFDGEWVAVGMLYPLFSWTSTIKDSIHRVGHIQRNISRYVPTVEVMMNTLMTKPEVVDRPGAVVFQADEPIELEFRNIGYSYPSAIKDKNSGCNTRAMDSRGNHSGTIKNVSFTVGRGERVALIGPSGAGKSTLHYLALRFMDPQFGAIIANGYDIRDLTQRSWRKAVAYIPQRAQIFDGTVRDNLLYALSKKERREWTDNKLRELMLVLAIDFGRRLDGENPLDIVVGREGVQLSGGQSQRLAIGAAVVKKPKLLFVDEATSHLDSTTEKAVLEGLNELLYGISTLVIAHRLSTVRSADKIVVLVDGKVEASASSFEKLGEVSETFRQLANDQNLEIG